MERGMERNSFFEGGGFAEGKVHQSSAEPKRPTDNSSIPKGGSCMLFSSISFQLLHRFLACCIDTIH